MYIWIDFFIKVLHNLKISKKILCIDYLICLVYHMVVTYAKDLSAEGILTSKRVQGYTYFMDHHVDQLRLLEKGNFSDFAQFVILLYLT